MNNGDAPYFPIWYTHGLLNESASDVKHAVVVLHGLNRNANDYFCWMLESPTMQSDGGNSIAVIALNFQELGDDCLPESEENTTQELYWSHSWADGRASEKVNGVDITSYGVIDNIVERLQESSAFPSLTSITIIGFSMGGQTIQRYAFATDADSTVSPKVPLYFIAADPSSWAYLNSSRVVYNSTNEKTVTGGCDWDTSSDAGADHCANIEFSDEPALGDDTCPTWDEWKYGLSNTTEGYISHTNLTLQAERYAARNVTYALGLYDVCYCPANAAYYSQNITGPSSDSNYCLNAYDTPTPGECYAHNLAEGCQAMSQGLNRVQRGLNYGEHVRRYYDNAGTSMFHRRILVDNVAHAAEEMFSATTMQSCIFGTGDGFSDCGQYLTY